jgi:hypothetical protein
MFVNLIGHVVHLNTSASGGFCNKNIGDAFFLVWKQESGDSINNSNDDTAIHTRAALLALEKKKKLKKKNKILRKIKKKASMKTSPSSSTSPTVSTPNISRSPSYSDHNHNQLKISIHNTSFSRQDSHSNLSNNNPQRELTSIMSSPKSTSSPRLTASKPNQISKANSRSMNQKSLLMVLGVNSGIANALEKRTPTRVSSPKNSLRKLPPTLDNSPSIAPQSGGSASTSIDTDLGQSLGLKVTDQGRITSTSAWGLDSGETGNESFESLYDEQNRVMTLTQEFDDASLNSACEKSPKVDSGEFKLEPISGSSSRDGCRSLSPRALPPLNSNSDKLFSRASPKRGNLTRGGAPSGTIDDDDMTPVMVGKLNIKPLVEQEERDIIKKKMGNSTSSSSQHDQVRSNSKEHIINALNPITDLSPKIVKVASSGSFTFDQKDDDSDSDSDLSDDLFNDHDHEDDEDDGPSSLPYFHPFAKLNSTKDPLIPFTLADLALKAMAQVAHDLDHLNAQTSGAALADELIKLNVFQNHKEPEEKDDDDDEEEQDSNKTPTRTPRSGPTSPIGSSSKGSSKKKAFFRSPPIEGSVRKGSTVSNDSSGNVTPVDSDIGASIDQGRFISRNKISSNGSLDSVTTSNSDGSSHPTSRRPSGVSNVGDDRKMFEPVIGARPVPRRGMRRVSSAVIGSSSSFMVEQTNLSSTLGTNGSGGTTGVKLNIPKKPPIRGIRRVASAVMGGSSMDFNATTSGTSTPDFKKPLQPTSAGRTRQTSKGSRPSSQRRRRRMSGARLEGGEKFGDSTSDGVKSMVASFRGLGKPVHLGYGLHCGWAIEGAVGSPLKIDATYLSPDVNIASRLESLTKTYGCDILLSEVYILFNFQKKKKHTHTVNSFFGFYHFLVPLFFFLINF